MIIIYYLIIIGIPVIILTKSIFVIISTNIKHRKVMNKMNEWSGMNEQLMTWGSEITDISIKTEYLEFCVDKMFNVRRLNYQDFVEGHQLYQSSESLKNEIISKYINHIPSLKQELRENKLNKILNYG